jgi:hypothetical protein
VQATVPGGKKRVLDEIKDLLGMGTSASARLLAEVTPGGY